MSREGHGRYLPAEDTYLLRDALEGFSGRACLEIGFGSGVVISSAAERFELAAATDVMSLTQARLARAAGVELLIADKASCFIDGSFDLVFFNPPYVPSDTIVDPAVDGGPSGIEVPTAFLRDGLRVVREGGSVMALLSDEGDLGEFEARCGAMGLGVERVAQRKLFFETLVVYKLERREAKAKARQVGKARR